MTHNSFQLFPEGLKLISACPVCGASYKPGQVRLIEEKGEAHLVHIQCQSCLGGVVALIVKGGIGISSVGLITDLTAEDVIRFKESDQITEDDCLAIHQILEKSTNYEFISQSGNS